MATVINPLFTRDPFESTAHRMLSMFKPIQKTRKKESDVLAFFATPVLDYVVLDSLYALDIAIRLINTLASVLKAAYLWTLHQQNTTAIVDPETQRELESAFNNISMIGSSIIAQTLNILFSTLSLVTRPIASVVEACNNDENSVASSYKAAAFA